MAEEKEFKTGISTIIKISTIQKLDDYSKTLNLKRSDIVRRILEYFIEHNDIEDLQA